MGVRYGCLVIFRVFILLPKKVIRSRKTRKNKQYKGQIKKNKQYKGQMKKNKQYKGQMKKNKYKEQMKKNKQ
jgi:hypothetical protein